MQQRIKFVATPPVPAGRYEIVFDNVGDADTGDMYHMSVNGLVVDGWLGYDESGDFAYSHPFDLGPSEDIKSVVDLLLRAELWAQEQDWGADRIFLRVACVGAAQLRAAASRLREETLIGPTNEEISMDKAAATRCEQVFFSLRHYSQTNLYFRRRRSE